jgi:hypothetical protein
MADWLLQEHTQWVMNISVSTHQPPFPKMSATNNRKYEDKFAPVLN